jgi:pimeloyl-ACP methyl ester carboxylesterase
MGRIARGGVVLVILLLVILAGLRGMAAWREADVLADVIPAEGRRIATEMGLVYLEEAGPADGTPVLLVHGSVGWSRLWADTSAALATAGYRAIAFDLPPMGYSDRDPASDYSRARQAQRILALVKALDVKPVVVAHSFGAGPATEAAMMDPQAFAGLVLVSAAVGLGSDGTGAQMPVLLRAQPVRQLLVSATATNMWVTRPLVQMFLYRRDMLTDAQVTMLQQPGTLQGSTGELARWLPSLMLPPVDARSTKPADYGALPLPVALIWGDHDTTTPLAQGQALAALMPGATLTILTDVGHIPQIEDPGGFQVALIAALAKVAPAP